MNPRGSSFDKPQGLVQLDEILSELVEIIGALNENSFTTSSVGDFHSQSNAASF
jgi:hypothetical protein